MRLWFREPPEGDIETSPITIGRYCLNAEDAPKGSLVRITDTNERLSETPEAWLVPAGIGGHLELIGMLAKKDRPVMVAVNGLGPIALGALRTTIGNGGLIHLFDARDQDPLAYTEQLAWLRAQPEPFAVMARSTEELVQAAAVGPHSLIVPDAVTIEFGPILRIARAQVANAPRPTSPAEVDHLLGREASLTVVKPMVRGEIITAKDLTIAVLEARGLSPILRERIVGKVLRYDIEPGEGLNFGHLEDKPVS